jgi:uroporphyrinogen-III synthase
MIYLLSPLKKEETISLPMISFRTTSKNIDFSNCDTLMFTSKQAVVTADKIDNRWKKFPSIAIGGATKKKIEELGGEVIYYPKKFYGKELASDIKDMFSSREILYLRPKVVSFDSRAFLKREGIELKEQIIYETSCINYTKDKTPKKGAIIIFTSPSTIKCFFKNFEWDSSYRAILIGNATKEHLPKECKYRVADEPLINSCIQKAKELLEDIKLS